MRGFPAAASTLPAGILACALIGALAGCTVIPQAEHGRTPPPPPMREAPPRPAPQRYDRPVYAPPAYAAPAPAISSTAPARSVERGGPLTYAALGQTVRVGGPSVTPLSVLEDSRCPSNARCVWAGQVRISIRIGKGPRREIISGQPIRVADGMLELAETRPDKVAGSRNQGAIATNAYRFGFRFTGGY